jgi:excisionase family DNA binding protein
VRKRPDDLLTVEEAADLLKLKPTLVRSLAARSLLPASRGAEADADWRFSKQQLLEHTASGVSPPAPIVESPPPPIVAARPRSRVLTVEQAAELLQVKPKTVRAFAHERKIPAVKMGKLWRFDEDLLRDWLARRAAENEARIAAPSPALPLNLVGIRIKSAASLSERLDQMLHESAPRKSPKSGRRSH